MTTVHRGLSLFAFLLGLSSCQEERIDTGPLGTEESSNESACVVSFSDMKTGIALAGEQAHVFFLPDNPPCSSGERVEPISARSEVYSPRATEIPSEVVFGAQDMPPFLRFPVEQPGSYHFSTTFSPVGGVFQSDLLVARAPSSLRPLSTLKAFCPFLERTTKGTWVCYSKIFRGNTEQEKLPYNTKMAVAGDTVWVAGDTQVQRYVDTGNELTLTDSWSDPELHDIEGLLASSQDLLLVGKIGFTPVIARYSSERLTPTTTVVPFWTALEVGPRAPEAILVRDGDWLMFLSRFSVTSPQIKACAYKLSPQGIQRTQDACQILPGWVVGYEPDVVWLTDRDRAPTSRLRRYLFKGGSLVEEGSLPLSSGIEIVSPNLRVSGSVPVLSTQWGRAPPQETLYAVVTWSPERQELLLDALNPGITRLIASRSFYWGLVDLGEEGFASRIYPRAPP